jgi:S-adenosylmethionine:tRNA ribosyltransferase-isomerase
VVAVGTTSLRTLESRARRRHGAAGSGRDAAVHHARLRVPRGRRAAHQLPPAEVDAADAGVGVRRRGAIRRAYAHAVAQRYRFFSYGDAMLLEPPGQAIRMR